MAVLADIVDEFKQATPGGKALMLVAVIAVAGVGIYVYKQKQAGNSNSAGTLVPIDSGSGGSGGTSGFSGGGSSGSGNTSGTGTTTPPPTTGTGTGITFQGGNPPHAPSPPTQQPSQPAKPQGIWVTVTKFPSQLSTLWGISQQYYGNGAYWQRIAQANNISNPKTLKIGQRLFVPGAT